MNTTKACDKYIEDDNFYFIKAKKIKCPVHFIYEDVINGSKVDEKDSIFKPCCGHYHTIRANKSVIICTNPKCVKKQKNYLKSLEAQEFFFYCNNPHCQ